MKYYKHHQRKRNLILLSIVVVLASALLVIGGLYAYRAFTPGNSHDTDYVPTKPSSTDSDPTKQEAQSTPDLTADYGACGTVTEQQITDILSPEASIEVQPAVNRGIGNLADGSTMHACVYSLAQNENGTKRLTIGVTRLGTSDLEDTTISAYSEYPSVDGVGEIAFFVPAVDSPPANEADPTPATTTYSLMTINGQYKIEFLLTMPRATDEFTNETAQAALTALARDATLPN